MADRTEPGSVRRAWRVALLPAILFVALGAVGIAFSAGGTPNVGRAESAALVLAFGVMLGAGLVIVAARPGHHIGWMLVVAAMSAVVYLASANLASTLWLRGELQGAPALLAAWLARWVWMGYAWTLLVPLIMTYPTGRLLSWHWAPVFWFASAQAALLAAAYALAPGPAEVGGPPNPFGSGQLAFLDAVAARLDGPTFGITLLPALLALILRYRSSAEEQRAQIRWLLYAVMLFAVYNLWGMAAAALGLPWIPQRWSAFAFTAFVALIALAIAVALLRYRLYDIDFIIRRTLVYSIVTALLAVLYLSGVIVLQLIFSRLAGSESAAAVALSTLAIAALFNPLRLRVQGWVDSRFYRRRYDARRVMDRFSRVARDETDLERLSGALAQAVTETLQPHGVRVWLLPPRSAAMRAGLRAQPVNRAGGP